MYTTRGYEHCQNRLADCSSGWQTGLNDENEQKKKNYNNEEKIR